MNYWLVKTEPQDYSIFNLKEDKKTLWTGVRNYQARSFLRKMKVGDRVLVYHSNSEPSGIAGLAIVNKEAVTDPTQFNKKSRHFDPKSSIDNPRWFAPELRFQKIFPFISLSLLRKTKSLKNLLILRKGNRLSVTPVTSKDYETIIQLSSLLSR
ncbi:MAG TPA: EVE domain-containing protein [Oligoflexia bacterium]|nr:EVE domain-containing protein [Oligoflexia bacterium]HMP27956.1 EVE domain-containing protein [Oligoflexia bacterium]